MLILGNDATNLNRQISTGTMIRTVPEIRIPIVLGLLKVVERLIVAPPRIAQLLPVIVVVPIAPNVQHIIQHARATQNLAPGPIAPAALHRQAGSAVRLGLVPPVELGELQIGRQRRDVRDLVLVGAGLQQQDFPAADLR